MLKMVRRIGDAVILAFLSLACGVSWCDITPLICLLVQVVIESQLLMRDCCAKYCVH